MDRVEKRYGDFGQCLEQCSYLLPAVIISDLIMVNLDSLISNT